MWTWDIAGLGAALSPLVTILARLMPPGALDGPTIIVHGKVQADQPNLFRNGFELASFIATAALVITAIVAFVLTRRQIDEARNTRLATLYATLEARWSSPEMIASKAAFTSVLEAYAHQGAGRSIGDYVSDEIVVLARNDAALYYRLFALPDFLEYIGMLESRGYLDLDDISPLLGMVCIQVHSYFATYIDRQQAKQRADLTDDPTRLGNAPDFYVCFTRLAGKFADKYRT